MLRFSQKVFSAYLAGTQPHYSDISFADQLGSVDALTVGGYAQGVNNSTTLTVQIEHSFDGIRWSNRNTSPEVSQAVGVGSTYVTAASDGPTTSTVKLPFVRLRVTFGGSTDTGVVWIWIMGRDPAR